VVLRLVLERLDRSDDLARGVADRRGTDLRRDAVPAPVEEGDFGVAIRAVGVVRSAPRFCDVIRRSGSTK